MKGHVTGVETETSRLEVPEDVAALYAWANLKGARYRDFSAARREVRAQQRARAAQVERETQAEAKERAEKAASETELAAREAAAAARFHQAQIRRATGEHRGELAFEQTAREKALQHAEELGRLAAQERLEAARLALAEHVAALAARRAAQEAVEAHLSAERQAQRYTGVILQADSLAPAQVPSGAVLYPANVWDAPARAGSAQPWLEGEMQPQRFPQRRSPLAVVPQGQSLSKTDTPLSALGPLQGQAARTRLLRAETMARPGSPPEDSAETHTETGSALSNSDRTAAGIGEQGNAAEPAADAASGPLFPAWIENESTDAAANETRVGSPIASPRRVSQGAHGDTLQQSRERVASRWYALRGVFDPTTPDMEPIQARTREVGSAMLAVFSLAGGVGKTSLTASLGRSLSAMGGSVLLADVTTQGILPFYFGAKDLRPGAVRTFAPPAGSSDAPITLVSCDLQSPDASGNGPQSVLLEQLSSARDRFEHLVIDLSPTAVAAMRQLARLDAAVLVPVTPDMNTVLSLSSTERFFAEMADSAGRPVQPHYILTQFDTSFALHLDVREVMRQRLGDRLLPFVIRRSQDVSDALAEGMTVIDYAPEAGVASDYGSLAQWARTMSKAAPGQPRGAHWSEP